ncbi:hypothetical protein LZ30DRAFT_749672 [Colletotrichum cereale]|nr:hypothetical protein LZ30DRAFT_749672 [Colletotrichum cereale]
MIRLPCLLVFAATQLLSVSAQECRNLLKPGYKTPIVARGWTFRLVTDGYDRPRIILFNQQGALLLVDARSGIKHLKLNDDGGTCSSVSGERTIIESLEHYHPMIKTLYASTVDRVYAWSYDAISGTVGGSNRTIIANISNTGHTTRTLLLPKKDPNILLVSRGSAANIDEDAARESTGHSQLRAFDIGSLNENSQPLNFATQGTILGWGLRNSVGVAEEPVTGGIWTVENSADQLKRNGVDIHRDNPAEELNFHGYLNGSTENQEVNYSYSNCFALWSTEDFPDRGGMRTGDQFSLISSRILNDTTCAISHISPSLSFQPHTAPLDMKFTTDGSEAFFTLHGSWNRDEPVGYKLSSTHFANGLPIEPADSRTSLTDIFSNADIDDCPDRCFRPVGLAWDNQQRLLMTLMPQGRYTFFNGLKYQLQ